MKAFYNNIQNFTVAQQIFALLAVICFAIFIASMDFANNIQTTQTTAVSFMGFVMFSFFAYVQEREI